MQFEASISMAEPMLPLSRQEVVIILSDNRITSTQQCSSFDFRNSAYKGTIAPMQELKLMRLIKPAMMLLSLLRG